MQLFTSADVPGALPELLASCSHNSTVKKEPMWRQMVIWINHENDPINRLACMTALSAASSKTELSSDDIDVIFDCVDKCSMRISSKIWDDHVEKLFIGAISVTLSNVLRAAPSVEVTLRYSSLWKRIVDWLGCAPRYCYSRCCPALWYTLRNVLNCAPKIASNLANEIFSVIASRLPFCATLECNAIKSVLSCLSACSKFCESHLFRFWHRLSATLFELGTHIDLARDNTISFDDNTPTGKAALSLFPHLVGGTISLGGHMIENIASALQALVQPENCHIMSLYLNIPFLSYIRAAEKLCMIHYLDETNAFNGVDLVCKGLNCFVLLNRLPSLRSMSVIRTSSLSLSHINELTQAVFKRNLSGLLSLCLESFIAVSRHCNNARICDEFRSLEKVSLHNIRSVSGVTHVCALTLASYASQLMAMAKQTSSTDFSSTKTLKKTRSTHGASKRRRSCAAENGVNRALLPDRLATVCAETITTLLGTRGISSFVPVSSAAWLQATVLSILAVRHKVNPRVQNDGAEYIMLSDALERARRTGAHEIELTVVHSERCKKHAIEQPQLSNSFAALDHISSRTYPGTGPVFTVKTLDNNSAVVRGLRDFYIFLNDSQSDLATTKTASEASINYKEDKTTSNPVQASYQAIENIASKKSTLRPLKRETDITITSCPELSTSSVLPQRELLPSSSQGLTKPHTQSSSNAEQVDDSDDDIPDIVM